MRRIAVGPTDRFWVFVVTGDVAPDLPGEVGQRRKDATREQVPFDFGKPEFDLVEPRGIGRRDVQMDVWMGLEKRLDFLGLVRREVIDNDVDLAPPRLGVDDVVEEVDEGVAGVPRNGLTDDLTSPDVQRDVQRERAVTVILKAVPLRAPGRQRQYRIQPIQGLNGRLL